ncbi:MAG: ABC transporter ATP-binding protein/permease [Bdellovibrionales bacterium]|nr:ABC transporter ATP-binding protein/permease [Bdellovibrionales bacterium]
MQKPIFRLLQYAKGYKSKIIAASLFSIVNKLFDIAPEILIGAAIDVVVSKENSFLAGFGVQDPWHQILVLGGLTFFIWLGESTFEYLYMIYWRNLAQWLQHDLRVDSYSHIQSLDLSYFEDKNTGNLISILNDDINQLERFLDGGANQMLQTLTAVVGVGAVFFYLSPTIAVLAFLPIPAIIVGAFYFQKKAIPLYAVVREKVGALSTRLNNNLSGIVTIKSFSKEKQEAQALAGESQAYVKANKEAIAVSSAFIPIIRMAILAGFMATFILGAWKVFNGELGVGSYGVLVFLTQRLLWPLTGLASTVDLYQRAMASTKRVLDLLNVPVEISSGPIQKQKLQGHFQFKNVNFKYKTGNLVLKNLNVEILPSKTTAFVGSTGSGKSTLVKLLLRFYEPTQGEIFLDNENLVNYDSHCLRQRVGLVSQDVFLFHGTIKENIAYAKPEASMDEVLKASQLAEAHEFIEKLPEGYDTIIGERGQKLSGGQRQRISIARAILKDPDVLILDEATSAVDNETEAAIQKSLNVITKNRTTIIIAHRLSTIVNADQIYVLENGEVEQSGQHKELIEKTGQYKTLWGVQTGQSQ